MLNFEPLLQNLWLFESNNTDCSIVDLENKIFGYLSIYFEPLLVLVRGHEFNKMESTLSENACIEISRIVRFRFLRRRLFKRKIA